MIPAKQHHLEKKLLEIQIDALALNAGASLSYFTGLHFHLMERPVVLLFCAGDTPLLILPELEVPKLEHLDYPIESFPYPDNPDRWPDIFKQAVSSRHLQGAKVGVEPQQLRLLEYNCLRSVLAESVFVDASEALFALRSIKDEEEISFMQRAVNIAEKALQATLPLAVIGTSEYDLAGELVVQLLRHGSEANLPFSPIVACGPNSANPHARPSDYRLAAGDLLVIDWGARWQGYTSDLTRTFGVGPVGPEERSIHTIVQQANGAGR